MIKLLLTVLVTIVLLLQMESISYVAGIAAEAALSGADLRGTRISLVIHAGGGLLVVLMPLALSLYKPRGMTSHGWRRQRERRTIPQP